MSVEEMRDGRTFQDAFNALYPRTSRSVENFDVIIKKNYPSYFFDHPVNKRLK